MSIYKVCQKVYVLESLQLEPCYCSFDWSFCIEFEYFVHFGHKLFQKKFVA